MRSRASRRRHGARTPAGGPSACARRLAARDATIVISPHQHGEAVRLLGLDPETVHWLPDGVDVERFAVRVPAAPSGARAGSSGSSTIPRAGTRSGVPGSVRYGEDEVLDAFFDAVTGEARPGADVRGALPRVQAGAVARTRLCARPGTDGGAGAARDLGWGAGRVGGRASAHRRHGEGSTASSSRAGAATAICRSDWRAPTASSRPRRPSRSASSTSRRCRADCR